MPLIDHFHPPISNERRWESFHSSWATRIADALTEKWLPPNYIAEEHVHFGATVEIDVGTFERELEGGTRSDRNGQSQALASPAPDAVLPAVFPDTFEVQVICTDTGPKLVAAIELISPGNKDRPAERRAFATKCASYLFQGISVIIVNIVTNRRANLHNEVLEVMEAPAAPIWTPGVTSMRWLTVLCDAMRRTKSTSGSRRSGSPSRYPTAARSARRPGDSCGFRVNLRRGMPQKADHRYVIVIERYPTTPR